jgi:hypothetical protein
MLVTNLAEIFTGIDDWLDTVEGLAEGAFRGMAVQAFKYVVNGTPEWTGNAAASWRLTVGAPATGGAETPFKDLELGGSPLNPEPFSKVRPNHSAIHYAYSIAKAEVPFIRLGADVYITNNAPYALEVEQNVRARDGKAFLRQVNLPVEMINAAQDKLSALGLLGTTKLLALNAETL